MFGYTNDMILANRVEWFCRRVEMNVPASMHLVWTWFWSNKNVYIRHLSWLQLSSRDHFTDSSNSLFMSLIVILIVEPDSTGSSSSIHEDRDFNRQSLAFRLLCKMVQTAAMFHNDLDMDLQYHSIFWPYLNCTCNCCTVVPSSARSWPCLLRAVMVDDDAVNLLRMKDGVVFTAKPEKLDLSVKVIHDLSLVFFHL